MAAHARRSTAVIDRRSKGLRPPQQFSPSERVRREDRELRDEAAGVRYQSTDHRVHNVVRDELLGIRLLIPARAARKVRDHLARVAQHDADVMAAQLVTQHSVIPRSANSEDA